MRVYVIRHANPESTDYDDDPDPGISDEGTEAATALGQWMTENDQIPTVLYASPMTRTQETAEAIASAIEEAGYAKPDVKTDARIGPQMSIKALIVELADDKSMSRVGIVSHHEAITAGLRVLDKPTHPDPFAQAELRIYKVKRKNAEWKEKERVVPSDLGGIDHY